MKTKTSSLFLIGAILSFSACTGLRIESDDQPPPHPDAHEVETSRAKELFDDNVFPVLTAKCGGCHSASGPAGNVTGFIDSDPTKAYDRVIGYTAIVGDFTYEHAPVINKIAAGHVGISYSNAELTKIAEWLEQERIERGIIDPGPGPDGGIPINLLAKFSGCMTYDNFVTANMANTWGNLGATNNQECQNCHATGGEGYIATADAQLFFSAISKHSAYLSQYFIVNQQLMPKAVDVNHTSFERVSQRQPPHVEHPTFDPSNGIASSQQFLELTRQVEAANLCGPPTLID